MRLLEVIVQNSDCLATTGGDLATPVLLIVAALVLVAVGALIM